MTGKQKKDNKRKLFNDKYGKCPCGCNWKVRKNNITKQEFLGCINYPTCKNTKPLHPLIVNFSEINNLIGGDKQRVSSLVLDLKKQVENKNITNNIVVATDNRDTDWLFEVIGSDIYKLKYIGTAK